MASRTGAGLAKQSLSRSGLYAMLIKGGGAALSYVMIVAFAHLLSLEDYGAFAYGLNAAVILSTIIGFGLPTGAMRYLPPLINRGEVGKARGTVQFGLVLTLANGVLITGLLLLSSLSPSVRHLAGSWTFMAPIALLSVGAAMGDFYAAVLRAQGETIVSMFPRDIGWRLLTPLLGLGLLQAGLGLNAPSALLCAALVQATMVAWQVVRSYQLLGRLGGGHAQWRQWPALKSSLPHLWAASIIFALVQQFDVVIVGSLLGKAEAGSYFAAQKTAQLLSLVLIAAGLATAPTMSALYHANRLDELQALCRKMAAAIAIVTAVGFVGLVALGKVFLGLFDPSFTSAYPILILAAFGTMVDAISGPNAYLMQMTRFEASYLKIMVGCYALVIAAQFVLVPTYGAIGAAMGSTGGVILWNFLSLAVLRRGAKLDPSVLSLVLPPQRPLPP